MIRGEEERTSKPEGNMYTHTVTWVRAANLLGSQDPQIKGLFFHDAQRITITVGFVADATHACVE